MKRNYSQRYLKRRKFFLVLPALVLPFITMAFWALGGGKDNQQLVAESGGGGLNTQLPGSSYKDDKAWDKMSFYEQAEKDSIKYLDEIKNDPYYKLKALNDMPDDLEDTSSFSAGSAYRRVSSEDKQLITSPYGKGYVDPNEEKIMQKLELLNKEINKPQEPRTPSRYNETKQENSELFTSDVDRLENMMQGINEGDADDPEMEKIESLLNKILDIQHPERVKEKTFQTSKLDERAVFSVKRPKEEVQVGLLQANHLFLRADTITPQQVIQAKFYGTKSSKLEEGSDNTIEAAIHETQTIVNGGMVKMRLLSDIDVNGVLIPRDNLIYGLGVMTGERLGIVINSIRYQASIYPVALKVYDVDGLQGVYIPGIINRDIGKDATDNALQRINMGMITSSVSGQAAAAGLDAAKHMLSKKVKLVKVTLKAGYRVLLKDDNEQQ